MPRSRSRRDCLRIGGVALWASLAGCVGQPRNEGTPTDDTADTPPEDTRKPPTGGTEAPGAPVDDWQFDPTDATGTAGPTRTAFATSTPAGAAPGSIGLAAGGAKGVDNYRNNIEEGYLPIPTDLTYEGLFYDYYFDTGGSGSCDSLFCPDYSIAMSEDPLGGTTERYLTVGLDSGLSKADFERKTLNLVVVLDISGSMSSSFSEYYYDRFGNKKEVEGDPDRPKIDVATESIAALTTHLRPDDRFGVVLFNDSSHLAKPMRTVGDTDMDAIRDHLRELVADGGTNVAAGIQEATEMLDPYSDADPTTHETRMITLTDAMPNIGERSAGGLRERLRENADRGIYSTFVGVGVDFNTELIDAITAIEGSNYYSVHSESDFEERLDAGFEYMVTPLVFDLSLELDTAGYDIERVYGSTAAEEATGEILHVNTLFPSPSKGGKAKGGIVLAKLVRNDGTRSLSLSATWETRAGARKATTAEIQFPDREPDYFANTGIRKGVLLTRYADLMKNWMIYERSYGDGSGDPPPEGAGIDVAPPEDELGQWERQSTDLVVSPRYRERFASFADHFAAELEAIGDETLQQELEILETLANYDG